MIEFLKQERHTQNYISEILGREKSTISRELRRNKNAVGTYNAEYAEELSDIRCKRKRFRNFTDQAKKEIEEKLIIQRNRNIC
jgi:IS30 family transposase